MAGKTPHATPSVPAIDGIARVILYVRDAARSARWYRDVLGLPVRQEQAGWVELDAKGLPLCLHSGREGGRVLEINCVSFRVEDFDAAHRALQLREVPGLTEPVSPCPGLRVLKFEDPDGNVLAIEGP